jgi:hypothetical protein
VNIITEHCACDLVVSRAERQYNVVWFVRYDVPWASDVIRHFRRDIIIMRAILRLLAKPV